MSRRRFLQAAAGTVGALGAGFLWPTAALAAGRDPNPIPGGFVNPTGGPFVHLNAPPGPADAAPGMGNEPSTITDFDGFIGSTQVQGTGTGTNTDTGDTFPLLFDSDLRFMQGIYQSVDGRFLEGRFVLVWLDLYQGQYDFTNYSTQIHDFDLGFMPNGVFWTTRLPDDNPLVINFEAGEATLIADLDVQDYTSIPNALALGLSVPAAVTYELRFRGPIARTVNVQDAANGFRGQFLENTATLSWSASRAGFKFVSDAADTSKSLFSEVGRESNGIFF